MSRSLSSVGCGTSDAQPPIAFDRAVPEARLRRLFVGPLSVGAVHRLLTDRLGLALSRPKLRRVHELSGGNPFFALELGRALQRGAIRLEEGEPLPGTLDSLVQNRLATLTPEARRYLLVAATLSHPTLDLIARAVGGDPAAGLASAFAGNVIEPHRDRIRFTHPLFASAISATADESERRALHRRLVGLVTDAEERAHHLAAGAEGPDADTASALEEAAGRADVRGAVTAAAELSEQARRLTPLDLEGARHRRTIQAASYAFAAGESGRTRALLEDALAEAPPGPRRAEVRYWIGRSLFYEGDRRLALELYRSALAEAGNDLSLRAELEMGISDVLFLMRADLRDAARYAVSAVAYAERIGDPSAQVRALGSFAVADAIVGGGEWRHALARAVALERQGAPVRLAENASFCLAVNLTWADEFDEARKILHALRERAGETAEDSALPWILANLSLVEFLAGRWDESGRLAEEAHEVALQVRQEPQRLFALGVRALVRASRGEVEGARDDAAGALERSEERGIMIATILASSALGVLELSLGRPEATHHVLGPLVRRLEEGGVREPGSARFIADEIEALIALGSLEEAEAILDRLELRSTQLDRASALAAGSRCRGLLHASRGDLPAALEALELALAEHQRLPIPFEQARTLLALGATRRRAKMKRAAREALEESLGTFEGLGARLWAGKARIELARIGGRRPPTGDLTPTERRIAELVAEGRTDKEIAAVVFVTSKTVGTQLSRIYRKVGVRSRTELAAWLNSDADASKK